MAQAVTELTPKRLLLFLILITEQRKMVIEIEIKAVVESNLEVLLCVVNSTAEITVSEKVPISPYCNN
jgi:hypothetical protein